MAASRDYDLGLIINPEAGDEQARAIVDRVTTTVADKGGQVVRVNAQGRRRLAYPIDHHRDGLYFFFDLIMQPDDVTELDRLLRVNEDVIRHLILVRDPRVVVQQRQRDAEAEAHAEAEARARAAAQAEAEARAAEAAAAAPASTAEPAAETEAEQPPAAAEEPAAQAEAPVEPAEEHEQEQVTTEPEANA
ncbi:MAG TPA: 30S ribosomal protein S6 [Ktedonobacterales bacterium]